MESRNVTTPDTLMDLIRNLVPPNLMQATMQQYRTNLKYPGNYAFNDSSGKGKKQLRKPGEIETWKITGEILTVRLKRAIRILLDKLIKLPREPLENWPSCGF